MTCEHKKAEFIGQFSMIGSYFCVECGLKIDPVVYHIISGIDHILFRDNGKFSEYFGNLKDEQKQIIKNFCAKNNLIYPPKIVE